MKWTRVTDPDDALRLLPAWFGGRMIGLRGSFGLLLTTGDVVRCTSIVAAHQSSTGIILIDVLLDHAGVPEGVDLAWRSKHFLGAPVPAATLATINLSHVTVAVEFVAAEYADKNDERALPSADEAALEFSEESEIKVAALQAVTGTLKP
jgi:hypothetical protein